MNGLSGSLLSIPKQKRFRKYRTFIEVFIAALFLSGLLFFFNYDINISFSLIIVLFFFLYLFPDLKRGILLFLIASYFLPVFMRIIYSIERTLPVRNSLAALPDVLLFLLIFAFIIKLLYKKEKVLKTSLDKYILAFIAINVIQIFNPTKSVLAGVYGARSILLPIGMYFLASQYFSSKNDVKKFLYVVIICSIIDILYALYQYFIDFPFFDKIYLNDFPYIERMMIWPSLGGYKGFHKLFSVSGGSYNLFYPLAFFAIILINLNSKYFGLKIKTLKYAFMLLLIILLLLGVERMPIAMIVIGIAFSCLDFESGKKFFKGAVTCFLVITMILISFNILKEPLLRTGRREFHRLAELHNPLETRTLKYRKARIWVTVVERVKHNMFGSGLGTGTVTSQTTREDTLIVAPHNWYLKILMETGFIGLFIFMLLVVKIMKEFILYLRKSENLMYRGLVKGLLGGTVAILSAGVANIPLEYHLGIFFWFLVGLVPLLPQLEKEQVVR